MSMAIGGYSNTRQIVFTRADGTVSGRVTKTGGNKSAKKTKKIQYNFKQVSARILQAKTSGNAAQTVIMARSKLALLCQKVKGGEYDDQELAAAIIHAEKMVRIAKKKQRNLKAEENAERGANGEDTALSEEEEQEDALSLEDFYAGDSEMDREQLQQMMQQMEQLMEEAMRAAEEAGGMEDLTQEMMADDMDPADVEMRKRKHRSDEMREIIEADMKYLKALFDKLEREKQSASGSRISSAASGNAHLELGGMEMPAAEGMTEIPVEGGNLDVTV